ncbi:nucleoporin NUP35-like [Sycon ciliatum]|uniref:nucleoporin NUP35-like n=1 Tax=Sycon ciliatum TaxID=27933 RepID=UPI0020A97764|eukprot:scpid38459/ scgid1205/ Nucleoporin NUP53; 35 kDa nucleoporin; Nuclear pore complex protein Nup53; Nucleoporin Nup35
MHPGMLSNRAGSTTPVPAPAQASLPPFLLGGASQSPPSRSAYGSGLPPSGLGGSSQKHQAFPQHRQSPGSPKSRKDVTNTAPPVDGLFDASAAGHPLHGQDTAGLGARTTADAGLGASPGIFSDQSSAAYPKYGHHQLANPSPLVASPGMAPVTPFAGTMGASHHTGVPGTIRQQGHPPSALATAQSTESMHSPHTTLNGDACGDITEQCWVTVFGFPADAAAYMLQEFAHYGTIIRHSMDVNTNWMHICYQSPLQARKALSKHGKVFMTSVMVGVVPCTDQKVMQLEQHARHEQSSADFTSPVMMRERQGFASQGQQQAARHGTPGGMRPLTSSFQTPNAAAGSAMRDPDTATPRKSDGVIGKAMEYMFGW